MGELFADVLPAGVLSVLSGDGKIAGDALVRHRDVRRIAFIGSVPTGRLIQQAAAETGVKTVSAELGGKNPLIVLPDADPVRAAEGAVKGMNFHWSGVGAIRLGSPLDPETEMGTMVSKAQYEKVMGYIELAQNGGATLVAGGTRPEGDQFEKGYFVRPTIFDGVTPEMAIAREEVFGPVLSVLTFADEEEAIAIANGTDFGLTASLWTDDVGRAHRIARRLEAGYVWINGASAHYIGCPFGGFKDSGVGREEGIEELHSFTQTKTVSTPL
jgi:2-formylbenzoate dehydrogenase